MLVKADADAFKQEELAEAQKRAVAAIQIEYQNLVLKDKWEIDCLLHSTQGNVDCFEKTRDSHIGWMEQIIERLTVDRETLAR
jgi:hypothetical protein